MSTLKDGEPCRECLQTGRCTQTCRTNGGGATIASGPGAGDAAIITTPAFMPNGERGVCITIRAHDGTITHTQLSEAAGRALAAHVLAALEKK